MNYGEIRDHVLRLIRRDTIAGDKYSPAYNNQQDYLNAIPGYINAALIEIASAYRKREAFVELFPRDAEPYGRYKRFVLPEDLLEIKDRGLFVPDGDLESPDREYVSNYRLMLPDYLLVPKYADKTMVLEYYRRPQLLPEHPENDCQIDATLQEQYAAALYAAAQLCLYDDAFMYASLMNEYKGKIMDLSTMITAEVRPIVDVYGHGLSTETGEYYV